LKRSQRTVRRPTGPVSVGAGQEVLLVHGLQHHDHGTLEHLVFEGGYPDGPGLAVALGHVGAAHGRRLVAAGFEAVEERLEVRLQGPLVLPAGLAVDARGSVLACATEGFSKKLVVDVVGQAQEGPLRRLPRQFRYPLESR
jgi:hypothetical protein